MHFNLSKLVVGGFSILANLFLLIEDKFTLLSKFIDQVYIKFTAKIMKYRFTFHILN